MSAEPIVTIGGQEVYYTGRPRRSLAEAGLPPPVEAARPQAESRTVADGTGLLFVLALAASLAVLLTAIMTRNTRRALRETGNRHPA